MPRLGVLGGGQLGRMFVHAAQQLGCTAVVLDPDPASPAGAVADRHLCAAFDDAGALTELVRLCDAVSTEFENVPAQTLALLAEQMPVAPSAAAVAVCQHRAREKAFFQRAGVPCAAYVGIDHEADLAPQRLQGLLPGILKSAQLGYDGKGQVAVADPDAVRAAWAALGGTACVLEKRLPLACEFSVIVARGRDGAAVELPAQRNLHRDGILAVTRVPAGVAPDLARQASQAALRLARLLDYVGVLCVEFFVVADGSLVANEMAPRPHNSGHHSIDSCDLSQFELQVRTLAGWPLAVPRLHSPAVMLNLLGDLWFDPAGQRRTPDWPALLALPGAHLHLYGKAEPRRGRKMGHLTLTAADAAAAEAMAQRAAALLGLAPW